MTKRKPKTYEEKLKILKFVEDNPSTKRCYIAEKFSIKEEALGHLVKISEKSQHGNKRKTVI